MGQFAIRVRHGQRDARRPPAAGGARKRRISPHAEVGRRAPRWPRRTVRGDAGLDRRVWPTERAGRRVGAHVGDSEWRDGDSVKSRRRERRIARANLRPLAEWRVQRSPQSERTEPAISSVISVEPTRAPTRRPAQAIGSRGGDRRQTDPLPRPKGKVLGPFAHPSPDASVRAGSPAAQRSRRCRTKRVPR